MALIGPSGAGKTSLLRVLASQWRPSAGRVELLGEEPWALSAAARQRLRAPSAWSTGAAAAATAAVVSAVLAGRLGQWPLWKSLASLVYPLDRAGAHDALQRLDLGDKLFQRCDQLSGGQLQRVGIARVLYQRAELILADEPVSAMDPVLAGHTLALLNREAAARGSTLLASLHAVDLALQHFPRVIGLRAGRIAFDLPAGEVDRAALDALYANEQLQAERASPASEPAVVHIPRC
ncbi:ATP-binding cassette domain-containing protein [Pseudomonas aeruginosa]|nr:ATP-binding cassette domain-containing protein [Pseudomonas aeruginosa]